MGHLDLYTSASDAHYCQQMPDTKIKEIKAHGYSVQFPWGSAVPYLHVPVSGFRITN